MLEAIKYDGTILEVLNQLLLPQETKYEKVVNVDEAWKVIKSMKVRGAPAISIVGALGLAVELRSSHVSSKNELHNLIKQRLDHLVTARLTAVNLKQVADSTVDHSLSLLQDEKVSVEQMKNRVIEKIEKLMETDVSVNKAIGAHGGMYILSDAEGPVTVLTHCNTGSLATAGYGTALGVIRWLHEQKRLSHVYCTETRPYNQGARLTAFELVHDHIPATLICDSMVSALLQKKKITAVIVGADRVAANGDTANKIGTYHMAISAQYHGVPFYVASPTSTLDMSLENGSLIPVEERPHSEMTTINSQRIAADGINCWNPAFDVTPAELITGGIITEHGVFPARSLKKCRNSLFL